MSWIARLVPRRVVFSRPAQNASERWEERQALLLRLEDRQGRVGWGEASPLPGYSPDTLDRARGVLRATDWGRLGAEVEAARTLVGALARIEAHVGSSPSARFAAETAALDLLGQRRGVPLHSLLGELTGAVAAEVPLAAWVQGADAAGTVAAARRAAAKGFGTLKLKLGRHLEVELAVARTIRRELGPDVALRFDATRSLPTQRAQAVMEALAELDAELLEEPVPLPRLSDWAPPTPVRLALDESLADDAAPVHLARLLDRGLVSAVVLKPMALGGFARCHGFAALARRRGAPVFVSHLLDGPVGRAAAGALALALGGELAHGLGPHAGLESWQAELAIDAGERLVATDAPGLGVRFLAGEPGRA